jgi:hypothetical protein
MVDILKTLVYNVFIQLTGQCNVLLRRVGGYGGSRDTKTGPRSNGRHGDAGISSSVPLKAEGYSLPKL